MKNGGSEHEVEKVFYAVFEMVSLKIRKTNIRKDGTMPHYDTANLIKIDINNSQMANVQCA